MALDELAQKLFGAKRAESNSVLVDSHTDTLVGTAVGDSADGSVMVELSSDVTNPDPLTIDGEVYYDDADTAVELPTTASVKAGDDVLVTVYGGTSLRSPVVTGVVGSGDRIAQEAAAASTLAGEAKAVAEATGQHFWDDDNGAHVTEATKEEFLANQSGPNSLINSLGMLIRNGLNNLMAILTSGIAMYDGLGNEASNIIATFSSNAVELARKFDRATPLESSISMFGGTTWIKSYYSLPNGNPDSRRSQRIVIGGELDEPDGEYAGYSTGYLSVNENFNATGQTDPHISSASLIAKSSTTGDYEYLLGVNSTGRISMRAAELWITDPTRPAGDRFEQFPMSALYDGLRFSRNAMSAQASTALSLTSTYQKVVLSSSASVGSLLSISSGGIKCSKAGFVRVSAFAHLASMTNAHVGNIQIRNGATAVAFASNRAVSDRIGIALPERVIEVAANDVIYLYAANTSGAAGQINANYMTYLTVEYI